MKDDAQIGLFGAPDAAGPVSEFSGGVPLLSPPSELLHAPLYLGTSSWNFTGWSGLVYPPAIRLEQLRQRGLNLYARHPLFKAAGIDRSYYAPLSASQFAHYAQQVPDDFLFIVKACRDISTPPEQLPNSSTAPGRDRFLDPEYAARAVVEPTAKGLGEKCGGIVFQFPPLRGALGRQPGQFAKRLTKFFARLPAGVPYFAEIRNKALYRPEYFVALKDAGVSHCYTVHPGAPSIREQRRFSGPPNDRGLLVRWNLRRDQQYEEAKEAFAPFNRLVAEDQATRLEIAELIAEALAADKRAIVLANNKAEGSAPLTLQKLATASGLEFGVRDEIGVRDRFSP